MIKFEKPNGTWIYFNPKHVVAVRSSTKDRLGHTVIITVNSKHVVTNQIDDVIYNLEMYNKVHNC